MKNHKHSKDSLKNSDFRIEGNIRLEAIDCQSNEISGLRF